jgi:hypothetical protein
MAGPVGRQVTRPHFRANESGSACWSPKAGRAFLIVPRFLTFWLLDLNLIKRRASRSRYEVHRRKREDYVAEKSWMS